MWTEALRREMRQIVSEIETVSEVKNEVHP